MNCYARSIRAKKTPQGIDDAECPHNASPKQAAHTGAG